MSRPIAIVTGGRRGIGLAVAVELARSGFDLAITDTRRDDVADAACERLRAEGGRVVFVASDIADLDRHGAALDEVTSVLGGVDCLVNNAGIAAPVRGDLLHLAPENFDKVMAVNLRGTVFFTQAVVRWMLEHPSQGDIPRSIVNITSVSAELASPDRADYCMSKAALSMWSKSLALRLADSGIGVYEVRPGIIRTDMTSGVSEKYDCLIADGLVPAGRWGEGADIGRIVAALAGGGFGFAMGSVINADGALAVPRL